jgi:hypothetical protein
VSTSSSFLLNSGRSVISSTNTSSCSWDYHGPIVSSGFIGISELEFIIPFGAMELCPISPCCIVDVSYSTRVGLIDCVFEVVTYSISTTFSGCGILSLCLWPFRVTYMYCLGAPNFGGFILSRIHTLSCLCIKC